MRFFAAPWLLLLGCNARSSEPTRDAGAEARLRFVEVGSSAGIDVPFDFEDGVVEAFWNDRPRPQNELIGMIGGLAADDFTGDGLVDLFVLGGASGAFWFENDGSGGFRDVTSELGVATDPLASGPVFADFDGDGRSDLLIGGIGERKIQLLRNAPKGFVDVTSDSGLTENFDTIGFGVGDVDSDGDLDVVAARWGQFFYPARNDPALMRRELFWLNDGSGHFSDHSELLRYPLRATRFSSEGELSEVALTPNFADVDGDGDADLLLTQDFQVSTVLRNDTRDASLPDFVNVTDSWVLDEDNGMGAALGDYDADGDLDWFITSITGNAPAYHFHTGNRLYQNDGHGNFRDVTDEAGVRDGSWGWGACFADFDNDGRLDLFHVNGWGFVDPRVREEAPEFLDDAARLFLANPASPGSFVEVATETGIDDRGQGRGVACFDYDRDGDVDVVLSNTGGPARLYQNQLDPTDGSNANHLSLRVRGSVRDARGIGVRVWLTTDEGTQMREIRIENHYVSQSPPELHFGLGAARRVNKLRIRWPDGRERVVSDVPVNQFLEFPAP